MAQEKRSSGSRRSAAKKKSHKRANRLRIAGAFLFVLFVIGLSALLATLGWNWASDLLALNKEYTSVIVTVDNRANFEDVVDVLAEEGLIKYKFLFNLYAWFSSADQKIVPGTYELNTEMDYRALVTNMSSSSSTRQTVDVTIPEGYSLDQIFQLLQSKGVSTVDKLQDMAANWPYKWEFLQDIPLGDYHRLEGYLFPDTYTFYQGEDAKYVLNKMLLRFYEMMEDYFHLFQADENGVTPNGYTLHQIVILASLIEKETDGEDYATISSVLYNRLNNPAAETAGYLQVDATLVYINGGTLPTEEDKTLDSPYNTYLYKGLPAGPISNPGMASLYAAIQPEKTGYYYYALNPASQRHEFSRTYQEHLNRLYKFSANG